MKTRGAISCLQRCSLVAVLLLGAGAFNRNAWGQEKPGPMVNQQAPAFQIQGIYGERYSLATFKGHILVMQFGASW